MDNFTHKKNQYCPFPIHRINPKVYVKRVFMKIKYFKNILKLCELQGRGGNEHMHTCIAHVSRSWTIQIILQMFLLSFFTLLPDLYEILDSVRSDPYIKYCFFGSNKEMHVKMPNLPRNITISNGEGFFSTTFIFEQHPIHWCGWGWARK